MELNDKNLVVLEGKEKLIYYKIKELFIIFKVLNRVPFFVLKSPL